MNAKAQFGIRDDFHQFGVDCLLFLFQTIEGLLDLPAPQQQVVSAQECQMG
jgi:hypothetical protein